MKNSPILSRAGLLCGFVLLFTACVGARQAEPLPTPQPTPERRPGTETDISAPDESTRPETDENSVSEVAEPAPTRFPAEKYADLEIVTLLPRDAIPAIDEPRFLSAEEADEFYDPTEIVMGVTFNGDTRAYSVPFLSNHEIVNDTVGGVKLAVTW